jgi:hypothetical protein
MYFVEAIAFTIPSPLPLAIGKFLVPFPASQKTVVREAYLVSDQTHRRDERREGRAERQTVRQARPAPRDAGLQDLTPILFPRMHLIIYGGLWFIFVGPRLSRLEFCGTPDAEVVDRPLPNSEKLFLLVLSRTDLPWQFRCW